MDGVAPLNTRQYTEKNVFPDDCLDGPKKATDGPKKATSFQGGPIGPGFVSGVPLPLPLPNNKPGVQPTARDIVDDFMTAVQNTGSDTAVQARSFWTELAEMAAQVLRRDVSSGDLAARDDFDDFMNSITSTGSEGSVQSRSFWSELAEMAAQVLRRDDTPGGLAARDDFGDFMDALTSTGSGQGVQSRSFWSELAEMAAQVLRRDDTPGDLAARDDFGDFMDALTSTGSGQGVQSRSFWSELAEMAAQVLRRDDSPDGLTRRYSVGASSLDAFLDYFMLNLRDLGPEAEIQARSIPDGAAETVARSAAADDFLNALLKTRDSPEITPDSLLSLASLASRTLDDLD